MSDILMITVAVPASKVGALYASLASIMGASAPSTISGKAEFPSTENMSAEEINGFSAPVGTGNSAPETPGNVSSPESGSGSENDGETDAAGTVFDPARHTGTKVKSGLWRMKAGLSRGPNEGEDSPTYVAPGSEPAKPSTPPPPPADDEDEFAAFRAAATETPATASARSWSDADLSKICNQGAIKDGNPARVQAIIAKYIPAGETSHSRNIPAAKREEFAREVESTLGIQYEG